MKNYFTFLFLLCFLSIKAQISITPLSVEEPEFNEVYFNNKQVISGKVINIPNDKFKDFGVSYAKVQFSPGLSNMESIPVNPDGSFSITFDHVFPIQEVWFSAGILGEEKSLLFCGLYLTSDIEITLDYEFLNNHGKNFQLTDDILSGTDAALTKYINDYILYRRSDQIEIGRKKNELNMKRDLGIEEYIKEYEKLYQSIIEIETDYIHKHPSPYAWILENERLSEYYGDLLVKHWRNTMSPELLEKINRHTPYLCSNNGVLFYSYLNNYYKIGKTQEERIIRWSELLESGPVLSKGRQEELNEMVLIERDIADGKPYDTVYYQSLGKELFNKLSGEFSRYRILEGLKRIDHLSQGPKKDICKLFIDQKDKKLALEGIASIYDSIRLPWVKDIVEKNIDALQSTNTEIEEAISSAINHEPPHNFYQPIMTFPFNAELYVINEYSADDFLKNLTKKYQGKGVVADIWATWCAPCLKEMPDSKLLNENISDDKVKFIYLCTSTGSNEEKWIRKIAELQLPGDHYFLEETIMQDLMKMFNYKGFPSYLVITQDGNYKPDAIKWISTVKKDQIIEMIK